MNKIIQIAAYRLDPNLRSKSDAQQSIAFVETAGIIWFLPFALGGLVWLVMATDIVVIRQAWPLLLLLLLAHHLFARLDFTFRRPTGGGLYTIVGGSFVNFVTWSAVLILGPVVLWLALLHELGRIFQRWWRSGGYRQQIHNNLLHLNSTLVLLSFVPLAALAVYGRFDGAYPLPGLVWSDLWPAIVATIVYVVLPVLLLLPIMYLGSRQNQGWWLFFRMILFANGFVAATLPFAILAAGLYTMLGLGVYLAVLGGGFMANLLAYHFSQILNSRDERAMELTVLEELGRQIIAAPPELAALPQLLNQRGSSLTGGAPIAIWLTDMGLLYQHGQQQPFDTESATAVLQQVLAANPDCNHLLQEEKGGTSLLLPILGENGRLSGGIQAGVKVERLPALQSLAAQIASAVHRAETYEQRIASEKMAHELEIAGKIQATFLPAEQPQRPGWDIAAMLIPARQTSGDFYDFVELDNGRIGFVVADVADKGTGAALYMALSRTLLRTYAMQFPTEPARALQAVNERILADTHSDQFVTVFYAVLDAVSGRLTYANAGHNPALLVGTQAAQLTITGIPLGMFPGQNWQQREVSLQPGDTLILYTDGVTEAMNGRQEEFGDQRLQQLATNHAGQPADQMQAAIRQAVQTFAGDAPQADDITLLLVKRNPG